VHVQYPNSLRQCSCTASSLASVLRMLKSQVRSPSRDILRPILDSLHHEASGLAKIPASMHSSNSVFLYCDPQPPLGVETSVYASLPVIW